MASASNLDEQALAKAGHLRSEAAKLLFAQPKAEEERATEYARSRSMRSFVDQEALAKARHLYSEVPKARQRGSQGKT